MPVSLGVWPRFQYFNQLEGRQEKRNRTVQSCTECRRRKSKCDRKFPCGPCTLRKEEHLCVEHQRVQSEGLTGYTHLQDFDTLATRVKELELMLLTLVNDNAGVLNLSRVQPYLEGVDENGDEQMRDQSMDVQDQTFGDDPPLVQIQELPAPPVEATQDRRTGVRFEETFVDTTGAGNDDAWFADAGQTHGGMRLSDIVNCGSTNISAGSSTTRLDAGADTSTGEQGNQQAPVSIAAQQLLEFGNGYAAHPPTWTSTTSAPGPTRTEPTSPPTTTRAAKRFSDGLRSRDIDHHHGIDSRTHSRAPSLTEHHAALALEDMALNRNVTRDAGTSSVGGGGGGGDVGGASGRGERTAWQAGMGMLEGTSSTGGVMMPGTQPSWARRVHVSGLDALPPIGQAQPIITYFMAELEWLFRIFHIPTFFQRLSVFHAQLPLVNPLTNDQAAFVALYAAIICTSLHLMDESSLANVGVTRTARASYLQELSDLVELALVKCDWGGVPRIETLQAFIIIGPYWSSCGRLEAHLGLLGTAVKVAHNLGLNRLGPELDGEATYQQVLNHFGRKWVMASDREVGRRIWWTLVELDWNAAPDHQFNHITPRNLSTCAEPAHVNDEHLVGHGPITPQPLDVHTGMSFFVNRLRFLYPFQRFVESAIENGRLRYAVAVETQSEFFHTIEDLSPFYRLNADFAMDLEQYATDARQLARMAAEKRVINITGHLRILRCHRFYLPEAYHIAKYNYSKEAVLRSSKWLLDNNPTRDPIPGVPLRFWPVSYSLLVATIISILHLCHVESLDVNDAALLVRRGIDALRVDQGSPALRASADAIQQLYEIEMAERQRKRHAQPPPMGSSWSKRKREEEEQDANKFQRLVKKAFGPPSVSPEQSRQTEAFKADKASAVPRSTAFDFMFPRDEAGPSYTNNLSTMPANAGSSGEQQSGFPVVPTPTGTTFLGDPSMFLPDENLLELMKWGASSMGPDTFGTGLWPFLGDTPSSHGGNKPF